MSLDLFPHHVDEESLLQDFIVDPQDPLFSGGSESESTYLSGSLTPIPLNSNTQNFNSSPKGFMSAYPNFPICHKCYNMIASERRKRSSPKKINPEDAILLQLRAKQPTPPWKDTVQSFKDIVHKSVRVETLQMRYSRLLKRVGNVSF
jgi:hypothetical protein